MLAHTCNLPVVLSELPLSQFPKRGSNELQLQHTEDAKQRKDVACIKTEINLGSCSLFHFKANFPSLPAHFVIPPQTINTSLLLNILRPGCLLIIVCSAIHRTLPSMTSPLLWISMADFGFKIDGALDLNLLLERMIYISLHPLNAPLPFHPGLWYLHTQTSSGSHNDVMCIMT